MKLRPMMRRFDRFVAFANKSLSSTWLNGIRLWVELVWNLKR